MGKTTGDSTGTDGLFLQTLVRTVILATAVAVFKFSTNSLRPRFLSGRKRKPVRVYMAGCFDMMHYGHCNALRQARDLGDVLVAGVISDEEIRASKGPPVMNMSERIVMATSVKWVDEVITDCPYTISEDFLNKLFTEHEIDYIIHGDDPCLLPDGSDPYASAKTAGRYKQIKRTEGVSSTDIVGRMLLCTNVSINNEHAALQRQVSHGRGKTTDDVGFGPRVSHFLPTSRRIAQFSNWKSPGLDSRVVYIDGAFDLFHAGHVETLRRAKEEHGDFLLVGIHADQTVSSRRGRDHPIMNLHERSLSVLSCRYVDEVIIGAPWEVSRDMIATFNISVVVHGTCTESNNASNGEADPYAAAKGLGMYKTVESPRDLTTSSLIKRVFDNYEVYRARNEKKAESEKKYYEDKVYVNGD